MLYCLQSGPKPPVPEFVLQISYECRDAVLGYTKQYTEEKASSHLCVAFLGKK